MREIKFKLWDCVDGRFRTDRMSISAKGKMYSSRPHSIFCQYTGRKDKNGKDLYDGDVLRSNAPGCEKLIFIVKWEEDRTRFVARCKGDGLIVIAPERWDVYSEIIGNIYENPELIDGVENG